MRLKDSFLSLIKGGIIGISSLIPFLSSGSVMKSLSVYNNFIEGISNILKKKNKKLYLIVIPILIGILGGLLGGVNVVSYFLEKFPNQTILLFIGLILGGIKLNYKNSSLKINIKNFIFFLLIIVSLLFFYILITKHISFILPSNILIKFILGLFIGFTIIIPGLPISSFTMSLNKYDYLSSMISDFNFINISSIVLFILGIIIGIILIVRIISVLTENYNSTMSLIFLSLLVISVIILLLNIKSFSFSFSNIFTCLLAFLWGYILAINLERENDK